MVQQPGDSEHSDAHATDRRLFFSTGAAVCFSLVAFVLFVWPWRYNRVSNCVRDTADAGALEYWCACDVGPPRFLPPPPPPPPPPHAAAAAAAAAAEAAETDNTDEGRRNSWE